ncbi:MAG TPA: hypothetical protein VFR97_13635 [Capillimicrobium sp.]|nr:hypothetical protein [Capillimicrobium sp.]
MRPRDWLLLLIGLDAGPGGPALDPVRVQKGMFLLAREGGLPPKERYWFVAYNYGPMSPRIYRDLDALERRGLVERRPAEDGLRWRPVAITADGAARVAELVAGAEDRERRIIAWLAATKRRMAGLTFAELLTDIYARYPAYAARSVFRR